jgi:hypothetical protein
MAEVDPAAVPAAGVIAVRTTLNEDGQGKCAEKA